MADVVYLHEKAPRPARSSVFPPQDAKILMFTGIRYERLEMPFSSPLKAGPDENRRGGQGGSAGKTRKN